MLEDADTNCRCCYLYIYAASEGKTSATKKEVMEEDQLAENGGGGRWGGKKRGKKSMR